MPVAKKRPNIKAAIKAAKPAETVVNICLRGDLNSQIADLESQREELLSMGASSLAGPGQTLVELEAQLKELREEQDRYTFPFRLREMSYRKWDQLEREHPPRDGKAERLNGETFLPALVRASVVDPKLDGEDWDDLLGVRAIHPGDCVLDVDTDNAACICREPVFGKSQYGMLTDAAITLNGNKDAMVPFGLLASMLRQINGNA